MEHKIGDKLMDEHRARVSDPFLPYVVAEVTRVTSRTVHLVIDGHRLKFYLESGKCTQSDFYELADFQQAGGRFSDAEFTRIRLNAYRSRVENLIRECPDYITLKAVFQILEANRNRVADAIIEQFALEDAST
jgi:hypothetical protein